MHAIADNNHGLSFLYLVHGHVTVPESMHGYTSETIIAWTCMHDHATKQ